MKQKQMKHLLVCAWLLALCAAGVAQGPPWARGGPPEQGGPGFNLLASELFADGKIVKGAPFSATALTESTQVLADGTRITRKMSATLARDSAGRTRRETRLESIGPLPIAGPPPHLIFINDVVAGAVYMLNVGERLARKTPLGAGGAAPPSGAPPAMPPNGTGKTETLGKQMIEGLEASGTRSLITLNAGEIGNDRPLLIVSERWEAPELQMTVLSKHSDPRLGETIYRLTNITRSEPAKSLFEVPADYKFVPGGPPPGVGGPPWQRGRKPPGF